MKKISLTTLFIVTFVVAVLCAFVFKSYRTEVQYDTNGWTDRSITLPGNSITILSEDGDVFLVKNATVDEVLHYDSGVSSIVVRLAALNRLRLYFNRGVFVVDDETMRCAEIESIL